MTRHAADAGFTLADRLAYPTPMTPVEVALVGAQVATELEGWHRGGVCHRAIRPELVEIRAGAHGRLLARLRASTDLTPPPLPARYRAPEELSGRPVGPAADVYALGAVLLDGLMGRSDQPPRVPDDLGSAWRYLLTGMIAESPADRPTAATVAYTLGQVPGVAVPPAAAAPEPPPEPVPRSKLLPAGTHVEPVPIDLARASRFARWRPPVPGRRRSQEPDVRRGRGDRPHPDDHG